MRQIGSIKAIYRYPVKSMAGQQVDQATIGWHGIEGDRRFAFMRVGNTTGFPWLNAVRLPELIRYRPCWPDSADSSGPPTYIRAPDGEDFDLGAEPLRHRLSTAFGAEVQLVQLNSGVFDEAKLSLISTSTLSAIGQAAGGEIDARAFRPNILIEPVGDQPFPENEWVGKIVAFGAGADSPAMNVILNDVRCSMINLDPDNGVVNPDVLKATARLNNNCAGIYGFPFRTGQISVGDPAYLVEV